MAIVIPQSAVRQPNENLAGAENGSRTWSICYKDTYAALKAATSLFEAGDIYNGGGTVRGILKTWNLNMIPGGYGSLTLYLSPADAASDEDTVGDSKLLKDVWSVHGVRNDKSILGFLGCSAVSQARRAYIEAWLKEPDGALAAQDKFRDSAGNEVELNDDDKKITAKLNKGIDSAMRFYPLITRKRSYSREPPAVLENLAYINTPPVPETSTCDGKTKVPTGLSTIVEKYKWLKCQDDADENDDGTWVRTEAWMGAQSWDEDLYGDDSKRWDV